MNCVNKSLEKYNTTLKNILKDYPDGFVPTGQKKGKKLETKHWTEYYTFDSEEEFTEWKDYCLQFMSAEKFNVLNMTMGLAQPYLFQDTN
jgi:antibiotic biosynthesis monooxygenase (ABM) superfamily enzyme